MASIITSLKFPGPLLTIGLLGVAAYGQQAPTAVKTFNPPIIQIGNVSTLAITITNPSAATITALAFTDTYVAGMTTASTSNLASTCGGAATASPGGLSLSGGSLTAMTNCVVSVSVTGTALGALVNDTGPITAMLLTGGPLTGMGATATLTVVAPPTVTKAFADSQIELLFIGTTLSFTITNPQANPIAFTDIALTDTLPAGLVLAGGLAPTTCGGGPITAPAGGTTITVTGATLAAGASCSFSVQVFGAALGTWMNTTGAVNAVGGTVIGNTASATVSVVDLFFTWFFNDSSGGIP